MKIVASARMLKRSPAATPRASPAGPAATSPMAPRPMAFTPAISFMRMTSQLRSPHSKKMSLMARCSGSEAEVSRVEGE